MSEPKIEVGTRVIYRGPIVPRQGEYGTVVAVHDWIEVNFDGDEADERMICAVANLSVENAA